MIYFVIAVVAIVVFSVIMAFVSDYNGPLWLVASILTAILLLVFVIVYSYNQKYDVKITDVNGKTYVYKDVHGFTDDRSGTVSFVDKNGEQFSYRVSSMKQTLSE